MFEFLSSAFSFVVGIFEYDLIPVGDSSISVLDFSVGILIICWLVHSLFHRYKSGGITQ